MSKPEVPKISLKKVKEKRRLIIENEMLLSCVGHVINERIFEKVLKCLHRYFPSVEKPVLKLSIDFIANKRLDWEDWWRLVARLTGNEYKLLQKQYVHENDKPSDEWRLCRIDSVPDPVSKRVEVFSRVEIGTGCPDLISAMFTQAQLDRFWDKLLGLTYKIRNKYIYVGYSDFENCLFWEYVNANGVGGDYTVTPSQQNQHKKVYRGNYVSSGQ